MRKIKEGRRTVNYEFDNGIVLVSYGMSPTGNHTVTVELQNGRTKTIQTNTPELSLTHRTLVGSWKDILKFDARSLPAVGEELANYIRQYESAPAKAKVETIAVTQEAQINDEVILEAGDRIQVIRERNPHSIYLDLGAMSDSIVFQGYNKRERYPIELRVEWNFPVLSASVYKLEEAYVITDDYVIEMVFYKDNDRGGSPEQVIAEVFNFLGIPIPKSDTLGSGLDLKTMFNYLVFKNGFTYEPHQ